MFFRFALDRRWLQRSKMFTLTRICYLAIIALLWGQPVQESLAPLLHLSMVFWIMTFRVDT
ncbi:hypothetical protein RN04_12250 [Arthrobacter sp. W1]|nr:hypothetical protein RN04_12250 [Arthrobacter sp. W1]